MKGMKGMKRMEYRILPHGGEKISVLGLGMGGIQSASEEEIEQVVSTAIEHGVNFFDLCASATSVYAPFARAIAGRREKVYFQQHFGAVYNEQGEYGWSRDVEKIKRTIDWEFKTLGTDTIDFGFLHCVDEDADYDALRENGVFEYLWTLKQQGVVRHIGFSSHTPSVANRILDTGVVDMMMFSINPAYDFEEGDAQERAMLMRRCARDGVGISVMKPFHAGKLLDAQASPFGVALTHSQCIQYALDRPGVLTVVPGVRGMADLRQLLAYVDADAQARDYSVIGGFTPAQVSGSCVYCHHCQPCPVGIDIGLVNKYYDVARMGDVLARGHYDKLDVKADACVQCGHCDSRCPFGVHQSARMQESAAYFAQK